MYKYIESIKYSKGTKSEGICFLVYIVVAVDKA